MNAKGPLKINSFQSGTVSGQLSVALFPLAGNKCSISYAKHTYRRNMY